MGLYQFLATTNPPCYGHKLNHLESVGNAFLFPFASTINTFSIKYQDSESCSALISKVCAAVVILLTLPITILGALLKGIGSIWPHEEFLATDITAKLTSERKLQQCYDLSEALKRVFLQHGLSKMVDGEIHPLFVMVSGTALGAVRHGGIIPWDDDCDFALFRENEEEFLGLKEALAQEGIEVRDLRFDSTYKLHFTQEKIREKYGDVPSSENGEIDIFIFDRMSDGCYTYATTLSRSRWSTEYFTPEDLETGFRLAPFGPPGKELTLPLLKEPDKYLARYYGENFKDFGIETHGHLHFNYGCGSINLPFLKLGAHYFKIEEWKNKCAPWL